MLEGYRQKQLASAQIDTTNVRLKKIKIPRILYTSYATLGNYSKNWILETEVWILNIIFKEAFRSNPRKKTFNSEHFSHSKILIQNHASDFLHFESWLLRKRCRKLLNKSWYYIKSWTGLAKDLFWIIENQFKRPFRLSGRKWKYLFTFPLTEIMQLPGATDCEK